MRYVCVCVCTHRFAVPTIFKHANFEHNDNGANADSNIEHTVEFWRTDTTVILFAIETGILLNYFYFYKSRVQLATINK